MHQVGLGTGVPGAEKARGAPGGGLNKGTWCKSLGFRTKSIQKSIKQPREPDRYRQSQAKPGRDKRERYPSTLFPHKLQHFGGFAVVVNPYIVHAVEADVGVAATVVEVVADEEAVVKGVTVLVGVL